MRRGPSDEVICYRWGANLDFSMDSTTPALTFLGTICWPYYNVSASDYFCTNYACLLVCLLADVLGFLFCIWVHVPINVTIIDLNDVEELFS